MQSLFVRLDGLLIGLCYILYPSPLPVSDNYLSIFKGNNFARSSAEWKIRHCLFSLITQSVKDNEYTHHYKLFFCDIYCIFFLHPIHLIVILIPQNENIKSCNFFSFSFLIKRWWLARSLSTSSPLNLWTYSFRVCET